jgi:hypothetical protein
VVAHLGASQVSVYLMIVGIVLAVVSAGAATWYPQSCINEIVRKAKGRALVELNTKLAATRSTGERRRIIAQMETLRASPDSVRPWGTAATWTAAFVCCR